MSAVRVLTVGDGDLTYSLALARCFGDSISLTATTLATESELRGKYSLASTCLEELTGRGCSVRHEVNATSLPESVGVQDHIIFNYPHLGLSTMHDEAKHAARHGVLISHFLKAASELLAPGGCIHIALSGNQPSAWLVPQRAAVCGLQLQHEQSTMNRSSFLGLTPAAKDASKRHQQAIEASQLLDRDAEATQLLCQNEIQQLHDAVEATGEEAAAASKQKATHSSWNHHLPIEPSTPQKGWSAGRKYRNGDLGVPHWLARWGYTHRRCEGDGQMAVHQSTALVFARVGEGHYTGCRPSQSAGVAAHAILQEDHGGGGGGDYLCALCRGRYESLEALQKHVTELAIPDPDIQTYTCKETKKQFASEYALRQFQKQRQLQREQNDAAAAEDKLAHRKAEDIHSPVASCDLSHLADLERIKCIVPATAEGLRARVWVRSKETCNLSEQLKTKKECLLAFKEQRLLLNGLVTQSACI